jgi:hypothetical protein
VAWRGGLHSHVLAAAAAFGSVALPSPVVPSTWGGMKQVQAELTSTIEGGRLGGMGIPKGQIKP